MNKWYYFDQALLFLIKEAEAWKVFVIWLGLNSIVCYHLWNPSFIWLPLMVIVSFFWGAFLAVLIIRYMNWREIDE